MSEATNKLRDVVIYSDSVIRVRDLAADAIEAVEAQVAEAVARLTAERDEAQGASILNANAVRLQKARAEAAKKELAEARAISAATAERVRNETQIATELRKDLADANDRLTSQSRSIEEMHAELTAAQDEMRSLRATISVLRADLAALKGQRDAQTRSYDRVAAECDALRLASLTWFNEKGEPELLATAEEVTERRKAAAKELAALRAKPRFRTRRVTEADVGEMLVHNGSFYESCRALGFRRRVDGAK